MVGGDEEMSVTVERWQAGEAQLKKDLEKEEEKPEGEEDIDARIKRDVLELKKEIKYPRKGACAEPELEPEGGPEDVMKELVKKGKPEGEKTDMLVLMLERVIDTVLLEEVAGLGNKMNRYREVLAEGIRTFAQDHQEDRADLSNLIEAFRQGWKVYRVNEHVKATLDTFMAAMNNQLWIPDEHVNA